MGIGSWRFEADHRSSDGFTVVNCGGRQPGTKVWRRPGCLRACRAACAGGRIESDWRWSRLRARRYPNSHGPWLRPQYLQENRLNIMGKVFGLFFFLKKYPTFGWFGKMHPGQITDTAIFGPIVYLNADTYYNFLDPLVYLSNYFNNKNVMKHCYYMVSPPSWWASSLENLRSLVQTVTTLVFFYN